MQKSRRVSHSRILGCLSLFIPIVVVAFERLFVLFQFSSEFKLIVFLLAGMGIACGVLSMWNSKETKLAFVVKAVSLIGVLLNVGLLYFAWVAKPPEMTGTVSNIYSTSLKLYVDLPADELVENNLNPQEPFFIVNITNNTLIYEQTEGGQIRMVDNRQLRENQHIKVEWDGSIYISEPAQVRAIRITILDQ